MVAWVIEMKKVLGGQLRRCSVSVIHQQSQLVWNSLRFWNWDGRFCPELVRTQTILHRYSYELLGTDSSCCLVGQAKCACKLDIRGTFPKPCASRVREGGPVRQKPANEKTVFSKNDSPTNLTLDTFTMATNVRTSLLFTLTIQYYYYYRTQQ